ncbi:MAG: DNA polymerase I [Syntrophomonadaceae bacterium]|nr:DNA polymerase I [Syntrophomonadaceae bacterium]
MGKERIMLVDGNSLLYRAFYALPLLRTRKGVFTNAVYGFLNMLFKIRKEHFHTHIVVAFDKDGKTLRLEEYSDYKAHRKPAPPELREQFLLVREILQYLDIDYLELSGYEGDDIIGTLAREAEERGMECLIVTGDQDELQLVSPQVQVLITKKGISETEKYDVDAVVARWGVLPEKLPDVKGLMGDASDNIPGVPGVGIKTATRLIKKFGSMEEVYQQLDAVTSARIRNNLETYKEQAFLSKRLATIITEVPLEVDFEEYRQQVPDKGRLIGLYQELEFNSFIKDLQEELGENEDRSEVVQLKDARQVSELLKQVESGEPVAVYLVTDHHHPMWAQLRSLCLACKGSCYQAVLEGDDAGKLEPLRPLLENKAIPKYIHNAKFAQVLLRRYGISLQGVEGDTLLLSYVLDPSYQGETLSEHLFNYLGVVVEEKEDPAQAAAHLADLCDTLQDETREEEIYPLYWEVELPISEVLADMELEGIRVDRVILENASHELELRIGRDEERIYELAGQEFNINSPRQLSKVLFEDLGLPPIKKTKTGYSTSADVLERLYEHHEIIGHILDYRTLAKLKSTYVDTLPGYIHPDTGRIHTIFKQAVTATGRLSSVEPNLQNIPIRGEGRQVRKAFTARDDGYVLLSGDYSQIDLRSLAHVSGDQALIDTFQSQLDIHRRTASEIFKVPLEQVDDELRQKAKAVNFGIVYGISEFGLARGTGVSRREAREYIDEYLDSYPGVKQYMRDVVTAGRNLGYVSTILGRRRYLPDLLSSNRTIRSMAERMALNTPIQGTSADIIKLAMLAIYAELKQRGLRTRMILQVHDELIFDVPVEELGEVAPLVKHCMENAYQLKVPLEVDLKVGPDWYNMEPWEGGHA